MSTIDLIYTITGTLSVPEDTEMDGSTLILPDGRRVTVDAYLCTHGSTNGLLTLIPDSELDSYPVEIEIDEVVVEYD